MFLFINLNINTILASYSESNSYLIFLTILILQQKNWKVGKICKVDARYLCFVWLPAALFVLAYCFKCSNSLSWCMIPSFCMHHQERSRSRIIKYLQITFSDNAAIELIFWLIFWVTYNWLAKIGRCSYNATVATHYFKSYLSSNVLLHWYRWKSLS